MSKTISFTLEESASLEVLVHVHYYFLKSGASQTIADGEPVAYDMLSSVSAT
jgi:hypothetical protein